tara:strand:+ start:1279 stop:3162 length:1884 start_codon:yes stop_codon:yes gene_type:complete
MKNQIKIILNIILYIIFIQLSTVLPKNDRNLNASIKTAEMLAKRGDSDNAISIYLGLNKKYPNNIAIIRSLKTLYKKNNKYQEGITFFQSQLKHEPKKAQSYIDLGEFYFLNDQIDESKKIWNDGVKRFNSKSFYRNLFSIFSRYNLDKDIGKLLLSGRTKFGNSFLTYEAGSFYQSRQAYDKAMDEYLAHLLYNKNRENLIQRRISRMSDDDDANNIILSKLLLISKKEPKIFLSLLADFYFQKQNYKEAFDTYRSWHKIGKWDQRKWLSFANNLRREGQYLVAVDTYNYFLKNSKNSNNTGRALLGLAKTFEDQVIPINKNNLIPYFFDENVFFKDSFTETTSISPVHLENSLSIYDSLLFSLPRSPLLAEAYFRLGEIQYNILQDFDGAQSLLKKALESNPNKNLELKIIEKIIDVNIAQGKLIQASEFLVRKINPNNKSVLNKKKILISLLNADIDSAKNIIQIELKTITPNDTYFNDLIELNDFLKQYTEKNEPNQATGFKHFLNAEFLIRQRKITEAISELGHILDKYPETSIVPLSTLRQALLLKKIQQYETALKLSLELENTWLADKSIILSGQIYELHLKDKEKAISRYMKILNEHKTSIYAEPIRYHIREIQTLTVK